MIEFRNAARTAPLISTDGGRCRAPLYYSISCVHPSIAARALWHESTFSDLVACRLFKFKANASPLNPEELVRLGLRILGGCSGTGDRYIHALASRMVSG